MLDGPQRFLVLFGLNGGLGQQRARLSNSGEAISVRKEAVVADLDKTRRQDVQTEAAQELRQREGHGSDLAVVGIGLVQLPGGDSPGVRDILEASRSGVDFPPQFGNPPSRRSSNRRSGSWRVRSRARR